MEDPSELKFKEGDSLHFLVPTPRTTDKFLILASDGRFFTLACDKLPSARGHGEPLRLMLDLDDRVELIDVFVHKPGRRRVIASKGGVRLHPAGGGGDRLPERAGKQVLNGEAVISQPAEGDHIAVVGDNGKNLNFAMDERPELPPGKGVKLPT